VVSRVKREDGCTTTSWFLVLANIEQIEGDVRIPDPASPTRALPVPFCCRNFRPE
jgi:hypothetical protein